VSYRGSGVLRKENVKRMIRLKVKEVAGAKHISQRKLSKLSEVDIKTLQKIFRDPYRIVTTETLDKLARALGVDARELIESVPDNAE
jgi:DNA-binding Xre family transcriptional regulator